MINRSIKNGWALIGLLLLLLPLHSCVPKSPVIHDYKANLLALWQIIDEKYCFVEQKGVDWNEIKAKYLKRLAQDQKTNAHYNDLDFFRLSEDMLQELKDGHVNLISSFNRSSYDGWEGDPTEGLNIYQRARFLKGGYYVTGGVTYTVLKFRSSKLKIGYMIYNSFMSSLGDMQFVLSVFKNCDGMIIDIRGNGGGLVDNASQLASYFIDKEYIVGYSSYKTGPGHNDFSPLKILYLSPNKHITYTEKPVVVLQDRGCFSAANDFLSKIQVAKNITTIGLKSGGGAGMPAMSELPNGWRVRYSAVRGYDRKKKSIENGIEPKIHVSNTSYDVDPKAPDMIMKTAIDFIAKSVKGNSVTDRP